MTEDDVPVAEPAGLPSGPSVEGPPAIEGWVREALRCPVTGARLVDGVGPDGEPELHSADADRPLAYPVRGGIPVLLESASRAL